MTNIQKSESIATGAVLGMKTIDACLKDKECRCIRKLSLKANMCAYPMTIVSKHAEN
jgi:hypothetical protein